MKHMSASRTRLVASLTVLATVVVPFVSSVQTAAASQREYGSLELTLDMPAGVEADRSYWYDIDGTDFGARGRLDPIGGAAFDGVPTGTFWVSIRDVEGYSFSYGGDCDENGRVEVTADATLTCEIVGTAMAAEPAEGEATLRIEKRLWNYGIGTAVFSDFSFTVNGEAQQLEADGANEMAVDAGVVYTVEELPAEGYAANYSGACDQNGNVTLKKGESGVCIVTNWLAVGGFNPEDGIPLAVARAKVAAVPSAAPAVSVTPKPTASAPPSVAPSPLVTDSGALLGLEICGTAGHWLWWVTLLVLAALLVWFGRRKGTYLWLIVIYALFWFFWAWKFCAFGSAWLPVLLAVIIWLLSVPRPGTEDEAVK